MNIGIVGAGNVGTGIARYLSTKHNVILSFTKTPNELDAAVARVGNGVRGGSPIEAIRHSDVVLLATPWGITLETVSELADPLSGKIVWDTTNPLLPDLSGLAIGTTTSGGEEVAKAAPEAEVIKAVAPFAEVLHSPSNIMGGHKPGVFVCGDDDRARSIVCSLIIDIDADPINAGPLKLARFTEPLGMLLVQLAYMQGFGSRIGAKLIIDKAEL